MTDDIKMWYFLQRFLIHFVGEEPFFIKRKNSNNNFIHKHHKFNSKKKLTFEKCTRLLNLIREMGYALFFYEFTYISVSSIEIYIYI